MLMTMRAIEKAMDEYKGYCVNCKKKTANNCEPDASKYPCPKCKKNSVYGIEEAVCRGYISIK